MATHDKSYTAPKGRPTRARGDGGRRGSRVPAIFEWIIVGVVLLALMVVAWYFSVRGDGGTVHDGAPGLGPRAVVAGPATTG